jgi:NADPH:quinone reductase
VQAAVCRAYGPPESVVVDDLPVPTLQPGEVLVRVAAASVNYPDVLLVANRYQVSAPVPFTPGSELAGVVVEVAPDVASDTAGWRADDEVYGAMFFGAFAELVAVPAQSLRRVPAGMDLRTAASFGVVYAAAYGALRSVAEVRPGEWVVVLGAAGGVGLAAVEVAKELGGRVLAAASTPAKLAVCEQKGADHGVDYTTEDLRLRIRELIGGADVVIDPVGGPWAEQALRSMTWGGRFVSVGFASGEIPRIPLNLVLLKGIRIMGYEMRNFGDHRPDLMARDREELSDLLALGRLRPHVSAVLPLRDVAEAMALVGSRRSTGKVVLDPNG